MPKDDHLSLGVRELLNCGVQVEVRDQVCRVTPARRGVGHLACSRQRSLWVCHACSLRRKVARAAQLPLVFGHGVSRNSIKPGEDRPAPVPVPPDALQGRQEHVAREVFGD